MGKEFIAFGNIEGEKHKLDHYKNQTFSNDVNIDYILMSSMVSSDQKTIKTS